jgi:hypothetical protein
VAYFLHLSQPPNSPFIYELINGVIHS